MSVMSDGGELRRSDAKSASNVYKDEGMSVSVSSHHLVE